MTGGGRGPLALHRRGGLPRGAQFGFGLSELAPCLLVPLRQLRVTRVESVDLGLELLVLLLRGDGALLCLITRLGQPVDLGLRRTGPAAGRIDLAVQPRQALAAV